MPKHKEQNLLNSTQNQASLGKEQLVEFPGLDKVFVHTSDTIFQIENVPKSIAIIGGGVIGVEFACIFALLNVEVTVIELAERIIGAEDEDASAVLLQALKKKGIRVLTGHQVTSLAQDHERKIVAVKTLKGEVEELAKMIHPHPTLSEGMFEAAAALTGEGIHIHVPGRR